MFTELLIAACHRDGTASSSLRGIVLHPLEVELLEERGRTVARVPEGVVVAYLLEQSRRKRCLHVFRCGRATSSSGGASILGVRPEVDLLLVARSVGRIRRIEALFAYLRKHGRDPSRLSDRFYLRLSLALGGRLPSAKVLPALLGDELMNS